MLCAKKSGRKRQGLADAAANTASDTTATTDDDDDDDDGDDDDGDGDIANFCSCLHLLLMPICDGCLLHVAVG
jgi:hypothetical protein